MSRSTWTGNTRSKDLLLCPEELLRVLVHVEERFVVGPKQNRSDAPSWGEDHVTNLVKEITSVLHGVLLAPLGDQFQSRVYANFSIDKLRIDLMTEAHTQTNISKAGLEFKNLTSAEAAMWNGILANGPLTGLAAGAQRLIKQASESLASLPHLADSPGGCQLCPGSME